jgi:hypothetical protein
MNTVSSSPNQPIQGILAIARAAILAMACTVSLTQTTQADPASLPALPANIQAPQGNKAFLVGHAVGTQNYICRRSGSDVKFVLFTPEAVLTKDDQQLTTHFFSPNPSETNTEATVTSEYMIRPAWRHSRDTSTVWAKMAPNGASAVTPEAIPWLLLQVVGAKEGPSGGHTLTATTFIQRVNTSGGIAPSAGCAAPTEIGNQAFVPYTADYVFYKKAAEGD